MNRVKELQILIDNSLFSDRAWEPESIKFRESIREQLRNALIKWCAQVNVLLQEMWNKSRDR